MFNWQKINENKIRFFMVLGFFIALVAGFYLLFFSSEEVIAPKENNNQVLDEDSGEENKQDEGVVLPLEDALSRITKKPFGVYITPESSPVQPERFSGFHTGVDFEIKKVEENSDVNVFAICEGKIVRKRIVSGYGGTITQECKISNEPVLVLYGHISLDNIGFDELESVKKGEKLTILANANSEMSGGERKHLHLGIYKGTVIDYAGYVVNESDLSNWLNFEDLI